MLTEKQTAPRRPHHHCGSGDGCADVPEFSRLRYFHGQPLGALDLRREQAYHLEKSRLQNRLLHGWGIICGLDIRVAEKPDCRPEDTDPTSTAIVALPGAALDCAGREIVVRHPRPVHPERMLGTSELEGLAKTPATVYLTLCYREVPADPMRPLLAHGCDPAPNCEHSRVIETFQICASTSRPDPGPTCEPCCGACGDPCLELAAIREFDPTVPIRADQLDVGGRRRLAQHAFPQITEINWVHGATYGREDANALLDAGLQVQFSRPVQVASLRPGVVELTGIDVGAGRSGTVYDIEGEFVDLPTSELTDHFTFRRTTGETLQYGDRLVITVRGDFIVDECCRAVDGNHIGGGVPVVGTAQYAPQSAPDRLCPPRPSGDGAEGGDFASWIYVAKRSDHA